MKTYPVMTEDQLVDAIESYTKRTDTMRWELGDKLAAQGWLTDSSLARVAKRADVEVGTLKTYREVSVMFPDSHWRRIRWGVLEKLRAVKDEADRMTIFKQKKVTEWTPTTMATEVSKFNRAKRIEAQNIKRAEQGLAPVDTVKDTIEYKPTKSGSRIWDHKLNSTFSEDTRELVIELDVALENTKLEVKDGKTRLVGILPLPEVDAGEFES